MRLFVLAGIVGALAMGAASCRRDSSSRTDDAARPRVAPNLVIPDQWKLLGVPTQDLVTVRSETTQDRFVADYRKSSIEMLASRVDKALVTAGYKQTCNQLDGQIRGYSNGLENLLVKVDLLGPVTELSVANKRGADKLLFGVCFEGYQLERTTPSLGAPPSKETTQ